MSQRTPKICQPMGKIVIPIEDGECLYWLIPVDSVDDIENPTRDFAWITPDGILYVFDGEKLVAINDPNTLKVQFQNVLGDPYDNGALADALNEKVATIKMNNQVVPMDTNNVVDLGCITTCDDLEQALAGIETMRAVLVDELPQTGSSDTIYLVPRETEPEYIMPCHEYSFTSTGTGYTTAWTTPTNAIPIVDGHSYQVTIGNDVEMGTGHIDNKYSVVSDTAEIISVDMGNTWTLTINLTDLPADYEEVEGNYNVNICVASLPDTVYEMNLWIDNEYRTVGAKPISIDISEIERQLSTKVSNIDRRIQQSETVTQSVTVGSARWQYVLFDVPLTIPSGYTYCGLNGITVGGGNARLLPFPEQFRTFNGTTYRCGIMVLNLSSEQRTENVSVSVHYMVEKIEY